MNTLNPETTKLGLGVSICYWGDREAATIIQVSEDLNTLVLRTDAMFLAQESVDEDEWIIIATATGKKRYAHWTHDRDCYLVDGQYRLIAGRHHHREKAF